MSSQDVARATACLHHVRPRDDPYTSRGQDRVHDAGGAESAPHGRQGRPDT